MWLKMKDFFLVIGLFFKILSACCVVLVLNGTVLFDNNAFHSQLQPEIPTESANRETNYSPVIRIKDEPIDEDYDKALIPQSDVSRIKQELENNENEVRFGLVLCSGAVQSVVKTCLMY